MYYDYRYKDDHNGIVPTRYGKVELKDGALSMQYDGSITEFYLNLDRENTDKLRELLGGNIKKNLQEKFKSDNILFEVRDFCEENGIDCNYFSWTSDDDCDRL